jgi:hypothetical protein
MWLSDSVSRLSSFLLKPLATCEMSYLLESCKLDYACHSDRILQVRDYTFPLVKKFSKFKYK